VIDVGLIGFGLAGRCFHAPVIRAVSGLRLAAILQRSGKDAASAYRDVRIVRSVDDLLAIESIQLIVIATPNQTHFALAKKCLETGRHVVVDKPFTTTVGEAVELFRIARTYNRVLTVYHNRRFDADFQALRQVVADKEIGEILRFESNYDRFRPAPKPGAWREQLGPGSGVLFDLAPHLIDHALTLLGKPESIAADIRIERHGMSTDDAFDLYSYYPGGVRAHLKATMMGITPRPRFVVLGTKGSFVKTNFDPLENSLRNGIVPSGDNWVLEKEENWGELTTAQNGEPSRRKVPSRGDWREFYANVRDALLGKAELLVKPQQVLDVMAALDRALQSNQHRCAVAWRDVSVGE
jgi:scyllo-inositol 2-dehydrogenase (NADP+)